MSAPDNLITDQERKDWPGNSDAEKLVIAYERACLEVAEYGAEAACYEYGALRRRIVKAIEDLALKEREQLREALWERMEKCSVCLWQWVRKHDGVGGLVREKIQNCDLCRKAERLLEGRGTLIDDWKLINGPCAECGAEGHLCCRTHEDDEGHEDFEYHCSNCDATYWREGIDY